MIKDIQTAIDVANGDAMPLNKYAAKVIAFYLPQFHPIPENDEWWGKGFTEWTNVAKSKPMFRGHYQPHVPADLGYYDLRLSEAREAQADMAIKYGLYGFCYYHYWFAGKQLLERPFNEVLDSGKPDYPFCLCWANETWTGVWHGSPGRILIEQTYPGTEDHKKHFLYMLKAFSDSRYIKVNEKPLFLIYKPWKIPELEKTLELWRKLANDYGLKGLHLVSVDAPCSRRDSALFDGFTQPSLGDWGSVPGKGLIRLHRAQYQRFINIIRNLRKLPRIIEYERVCVGLLAYGISDYAVYQCLLPNWDNTPRSGRRGVVLHRSTPELFRKQVAAALKLSKANVGDEKIIFVKSWNEWAEGNHLEPDIKYGHEYLEVLKQELLRENNL
jgi:lipopolysaccharide biosynthesis protein